MMTRRRNRIKKTKHKKIYKNYYKKPHCAPSSKNINTMTCYTDDKLLKMRNYWNSRHPDAKISTKEPHKIWKQLRLNMKHICNTEKCWLNQSFIIFKKGLYYIDPSIFKHHPFQII